MEHHPGYLTIQDPLWPSQPLTLLSRAGNPHHELRRVAERHLGPIADQRYNFAEAALEAFVRDAGFKNVELKTISRTIHFDDGGPFVRLNSMAFVGLSAAGKGMGEEQRRQAVDAIVTDSAAVLNSHAKGSAVDFDLRTNVATARG